MKPTAYSKDFPYNALFAAFVYRVSFLFLVDLVVVFINCRSPAVEEVSLGLEEDGLDTLCN